VFLGEVMGLRFSSLGVGRYYGLVKMWVDVLESGKYDAGSGMLKTL